MPQAKKPLAPIFLSGCSNVFRKYGENSGTSSVNPAGTYQLEKDLKAALDEAGREILEDQLNQVEPAEKQSAAAKVRFHKATFRINKRTKATIATSFGPITVWSFYYLNQDDGEPGLHPLHRRLGIVAGTTPVLANAWHAGR